MKAMRLRLVAAWLGCSALALAALALAGAALVAPLDATQRAAAFELLAAAAPLPALAVVGILVGCGFVASWIVASYFRPLAALAESAAILAHANPSHRIETTGPDELKSLGIALNEIADGMRTSAERTREHVERANRSVETEKNRLAVLMAQLPQSVLVCDRRGSIMLYNEQARRLLGPSPRDDRPAGYLGLGRPVQALLDRQAVDDALATLSRRERDGEIDPVDSFSLALTGDLVVRVRVASMAGRAEDGGPLPSGYVLLLEDVTGEVLGVQQRDRILGEAVAAARHALAVLRPALDRYAAQPPGGAGVAATAAAVEACSELSAALDACESAHTLLERERADDVDTLRPAELLDLLAMAVRESECTVTLPTMPEGGSLRLPVHVVVQATRYLVRRLTSEFPVREVMLELDLSGDGPRLSACWLGHRLSAATLAAWEEDALAAGGEASPLTLRELLRRQGMELAFEIERASGRSRLALVLPRTSVRSPDTGAAPRPRPVFYDFDLPAAAQSPAELASLPLGALSYTVFDTETTGLDPGGGDEIIAIGAVRIVNARLLEDETFDQLVDPRRPSHPDAVKVHGIEDAMLRGQPPIERVLPRFHAFCEATVLVGHNVAFDLRFLQMKEAALGIAFPHPVLDTLLLAHVLNEHTGDHRLEALAHRLGIEVVARHTALGDARATAAVFLKMIALLEARGICTLGEALAASEKTPYARLRY